MNAELRNPNTELLFQAILELHDMEECYRFFEDLCTIPEIKALTQRIVVAKMLRNKQIYSHIVTQTRASTATISRVKRSMNYGNGSYDMVFSRMEEKDQKV